MYPLLINLSDILQLIEVVAVLVTTGIAIYGISIWRRQLNWQRREDLKVRVLTNMYQIQRAIRKMRFSVGVISEGDTPYEILMSRYRNYQEQIDKIDFLKDELKAIMGDKFLEPYDVLIQHLKDLRKAARKLSGERGKLTEDEIKKANRVLYNDGKEEDEIIRSIQEAISDMRDRFNS